MLAAAASLGQAASWPHWPAFLGLHYAKPASVRALLAVEYSVCWWTTDTVTALVVRRMTRICILSKIIIDTIGGAHRLGGGGVQAAVGVKLAAPDAACTLVAPVGVDFDAALLDGLREGYGVQMCIEALAHVPVTPGETIWYEGETMRWDNHGWEGWVELCAWQPVLPQADAYHVIVEGGGDGEVRAAQAALAAAAARGEQRPWLSVEPVMHEVRHAEVAGLSGPPAPRTTCRPVEPRALSPWLEA